MLVLLLHRSHGESGCARVAVRQHLWCSVSDTSSFAYSVIFILGALCLNISLRYRIFEEDTYAVYCANVGDISTNY